MVLLSVIVPVYKTEKYLPQCIESILAQTVRDLELILVDDGSPDNSGRICDEYAGHYCNIKVVHKPNEGLTAARKSGIMAAEGKYVAFVDSDDWIDPNMYEVLLDHAQRHGADIVSGGYLAQFDDHTERCCNAVDSGVYTGKKLEQLWENAVFSVPDMCQGLAPSTCTKVYLRESAAESFLSRTDSVSFGEDALFTYPVLFKSKCVVVDNDHCAYHYRILGNSMSHSYGKSYFPDLHMLYDKLHLAASGVMTEGISRSIAYNYVFLFANGVSLVMGRGNKVSYWEKYRMVSEQLDDARLKQSLDLVELDRFPRHTASQLQLLAQHKPGAFVLHYLMHLVTSRAARLVKR